MNGPFLTERGILLALLPAALDDHAVGPLVVARLEPFGTLTPRRARMPAAAGASLATAHRMVDRVHRYATVVRPKAEPARAPGFAPRDVLVIGVGDLADGRTAIEVNAANLAARKPDLTPGALF